MTQIDKLSRHMGVSLYQFCASKLARSRLDEQPGTDLRIV
jgi:hypothetical protein